METYVSSDARQVIERLATIGVQVEGDDLFDLEHCCATWYTTHIIGVIDSVLKGGNQVAKVLKAQDQGWQYFAKPVKSMLKGRHPAWREEGNRVHADHAPKIYRAVTRTLLLADMNRTEADLLIFDIPHMVDVAGLSSAVQACKSQNKRTVYYLNGVIKREVQTAAGRRREIEQDRSMNSPWEPPEDFEPAGIDAAALWADRLNNIKIQKELRNALP